MEMFTHHPVIRREAFLSQPPYVEFNPMDRAWICYSRFNIDENGSIITSSAEGFLERIVFESWNGLSFISSS